MKNLHLLPTDKSSRLIIQNGNRLIIGVLDYSIIENRQHIYITNSEEIKEGDWFITNNNEIFKCIKNKEEQCFYSLNASILTKFCKKIILTTDQDLIKDDIQTIDDDFLQWFVKNPSCEEVEVQKWFDGVDFLEYKIIIPKEESKQEISYNEVFEWLASKDYLSDKVDTIQKEFEQFKKK